MSLELLQTVEQAEKRAEEMRNDAQQKARALLKSVEEACAAKERAAQEEHRALQQQEVENAERKARGQNAEEMQRLATARSADHMKARQKLSVAADYIMERVAKNGNH